MSPPGPLAYYTMGANGENPLDLCEYDWGKGNCERKTSMGASGQLLPFIKPTDSAIAESNANSAQGGQKRRTRSRSRSRKPAARKTTASATKCEWRLTHEKVKVMRRRTDGTREKVERSVYKNKKGERRIRKLTKSRGGITAVYVPFTPALKKKKNTKR